MQGGTEDDSGAIRREAPGRRAAGKKNHESIKKSMRTDYSDSEGYSDSFSIHTSDIESESLWSKATSMFSGGGGGDDDDEYEGSQGSQSGDIEDQMEFAERLKNDRDFMEAEVKPHTHTLTHSHSLTHSLVRSFVRFFFFFLGCVWQVHRSP